MTTSSSPDFRALDARRTILVQRLEDGDRRIAAARESGANIAQWEAFWLHLLEDYVDVSRQLGARESDVLDVAA